MLWRCEADPSCMLMPLQATGSQLSEGIIHKEDCEM